jgi:hypothetical protein
MSGSYWLSVRDKGGFAVLRRDNLLGFLSSFSSIHPTLRPIYEDMSTNLILDANDKTFLEKIIIHALCTEI